MNRFARSCMTSEKVRFTLQIENFSTYVCKGFYVSPKFESQPSGSKWSLVVHASDGADYQNFIDVRLKREEYVVEEQFVEVKVSIVDCLGLNALEEAKEIFFTGVKDEQILSVTKARMFDNYGLNKLRYLPNDKLTLQCEFTIYEDTVLFYDSKEDFENPENSISPGRNNFVEYFVHSHLTSETFDFIRRVEDFSLHTCKGQYVCPEFQSNFSDSKWSLVVYISDDDYGGDFVDIRLKRSDGYDGQLAKVKLSIVDRSGKALLSEEKQVYFTDSKEARVLSVTQKYMSSWLGLNKRCLIPDDTLTLHCEVVTYEEEVDAFDRKEHFDYGIKTRGYLRKLLLPWLLYSLAVVVGLICMYYAVLHVIVPFILDYVVPLVGTMLLFLFVVAALTKMFLDLKYDAEDIIKNSSKRNFRKQKRSNFHTGQEMVPYEKQEVVPYEKQEVVPYRKQGKGSYRSKQVVDVIYSRHGNPNYYYSYY